MVRRWRVQGRVQGVGFRWFVCRRAHALGLGGYASNLADGSVEVVARGDEDALAQLEAALRLGPRLAAVSSVDKENIPHEMNLPTPFEAR
jgi:acylphosphatase